MTQAVSADLLDSDRADAVIANVRDLITQNSVETVIHACLMMEELNLTESAKNITSPLLVIASTFEYITPFRTAKSGAGSEYLTQHVRNCVLKLYDDADHADLLEKKDVTIPLIIYFSEKGLGAEPTTRDGSWSCDNAPMRCRARSHAAVSRGFFDLG